MQIPKGATGAEVDASARRWTYRGIIAGMLFAGLAVVAWQWRAGVVITSVEVRDACESSWFIETPGCIAIRADRDKIVAAAAIETGGLLYEVDPGDIVARVSVHPWVASASVSRTPGGKVIVEILPRVPTVLVMQRGHPAFYVDRDGYAMPFVEGVAYDVPLVFGSVGHIQSGLVSDDRVRDLAAVMVDLDPEIDALVSEIELKADGIAVIRTTPSDLAGSSSIEALLALDGLDKQLRVLRAYWDQVLLAPAAKSIRQVDLRFDSRVITR